MMMESVGNGRIVGWRMSESKASPRKSVSRSVNIFVRRVKEKVMMSLLLC